MGIVLGVKADSIVVAEGNMPGEDISGIVERPTYKSIYKNPGWL